MSTTRSNASNHYRGARSSFSSIAALQKLTQDEPSNAQAFRYLAMCHEHKYLGLKADKAKFLYEKAAKLGDDVALYRLGLYEQDQDLNKAIEYYFQSAKCEAKHLDGSREALKKLEQFANQDEPNALALIYLGRCYQHGYAGLTKNFERTKELYHQANAIDQAQVMHTLNLQEKLQCLLNIVGNEEFIKGTHKGLNEIKPILALQEFGSALEKWLNIHATANKRAGVIKARIFGSAYRNSNLDRLYKAIREDDLDALKQIEKEIPATPKNLSAPARLERS